MVIRINEVNSKDNITLKKSEITASKPANIPIGQKDVKTEELLLKLGVTYEQYVQLCTEYPDFPALAFEQQKMIAADKYTNPVPAVEKETVEIVDASAETSESTNSVKETTSATPEQTPIFDNKAFSEMPLEQKFETYAYELAKNKFLYGGETPKSPDDWNALSSEEKQKLIATSKQNAAVSGSKEMFEDASISYLLEEKMISLQAANSVKTSVDNFNNDKVTPKEKRLDAIHEYIFGMDDTERSKAQQKYIEEQTFLSKALIHASKSDSNNEYKDDVSYILSENEISEKLKELGKTRIEIQLDYLKSKKDKGVKLAPEEQNKFDNLNKLANTDAYKLLSEKVKGREVNRTENVDYGRLKALENSEYKDVWASAKGFDDKIMVLDAYVTKHFGNLSPEEKAKAASQLYDELLNDTNNIELVVALQGISIAKADKASQVAIVQDTTGLAPELTSINVDKLGDDNEVLNALSQVHQNLEETDPSRAEALQSTVLDYSSEDQDAALSSVYSQAKSEKIQQKMGEKAFEAKNVKNQKIIIHNGSINSTEKVRSELIKRTNELDASYQLEGAKDLAGGSKIVLKSMNESEVITRFAKENQTEGFKYLKNNIEKLFEEKEAIQQLNTLTDQIPKCHKDNQLEMHNDIMQSKYLEVQERAASNINKLDPTVQNDAVDSVIRSGNEKAISSAMNSLQKCSPEVQKVQTVNMAVQNAIENAEAEEKAKLINSTHLTPEQFEKLTPSEKKEYYKRIFDKASPGEKIEMLSKLPGSQQKTVYTLICRFFPEVLSSMLKDSTTAEKMLNSGMPVDAVNKVITILQSSEDLEIIKLLDKMSQNPLYKSYFADKKDNEIKETEAKDTKLDAEYKGNGIDFITNTFATSPKDLALKNKKIKGNMDLRV